MQFSGFAPLVWQAAASTPSSTPTDGATNLGDQAQVAVSATFDVVQLIIGVVIGAVVGLLVGLVLIVILRILAGRHPRFKPVQQAIARPLDILLMVVGGWVGFTLSKSSVEKDIAPSWLEWVNHAFLIVTILVATWVVVQLINGTVTSIYQRIGEVSEDRAARVRTQVQILHRVIVVGVWTLGISAVLLTFPGARAAGASLMASAGIISVVAGLAAQTTLGNVFAGLQLAFTDSIRVGDIVNYNGEYTTVEEITLTYVVLAIWDGRRIIVPSQKMTSEPFENWTRRAPEMYGTVSWEVDWAIPIDAARKELNHLLESTDLWDGRLGVLQVVDASKGALTVRALVSAKDSPTLTDLSNYLREQMVVWIQKEAPQAVPHYRRYIHEDLDFEQATAATLEAVEERVNTETEQIVPEADSPIDAPVAESTPRYRTPDELAVQDSQRTVVMSSEDIQAIKRTSIADRTQEPDTLGDDSNETVFLDDSTRTSTTSQVRPGHEASLFSGSPENEERAQTYSGPGQKAYTERNRKVEEGQQPGGGSGDRSGDEEINETQVLSDADGTDPNKKAREAGPIETSSKPAKASTTDADIDADAQTD